MLHMYTAFLLSGSHSVLPPLQVDWPPMFCIWFDNGQA